MEEKVRIKYLEALGKYVKEIVGIRKDTRERVDWDNYFLNIATMIATRATCLRRAFGAVIVDPETNSIVSTAIAEMRVRLLIA